MEEILKQFKDFLSQIAWSESEADELRGKIEGIPGGRKNLFRKIDKKGEGSIGATQICQFCDDQGIPLNQNKQQILAKYFRAQNDSLTFEEFCMVLKPKNLTLWKPLELGREQPTPVFCSLVSCVLKAYEQLERKRSALSQIVSELEKYFQENYFTDKNLSKEVLQNFMRDEGMYTRTKYEHICSYIYGEYESSIPWSVFLPQKDHSVEPQENEELDRSQMKKTVQKVSKEKESTSRVSKKPQKRTDSEMDKVLHQIDELERALHDKKNKLKNRQEQLKNQNQQSESRSTLIGKVVSYSKPREESCLSQNSSRISYKRGAEGHELKEQHLDSRANNLSRNLRRNRFISNDGDRKNEESDFSRSYYEMNPLTHQPYPSAFYDNFVRNREKKYLGRSTSQAQLKIQEIEHRAMNKYLSKRHRDYLPNDSTVPYYYYHQYKRQREPHKKYEQFFNQVGMIKSASNSRLFSYSPRHQLQNKLYNGNSSSVLRPMTPHYLRY